MKRPSLLRSLATVAAAAVVISGVGLGAAQVASAAPIGTVTFNGLTNQTTGFSSTTSGPCPTAPTLATNFQIRITSISGNLAAPALITGNTAGSTVGGITDAAFAAVGQVSLQTFAIANSVPNAATAGLGAGVYQWDVVCRTNTSGASLGEFTGQFTVASLTSVTPIAPPPPADKATTTTLTTNPVGSSTVGDSVTLSATVATTPASASIPTGTVQFKVDGANLGAPAALNASGVATLPTTALAAGSRSLTAVYTAGTGFTGSTSAPVAFTVNAVPLDDTTTTLVPSPASPSVFGATVTLTATVANTTAPGTTPTGSVQFKVDGADLGAPAALTSGVATLDTTALAVGARSLTAVYVPTGAFDPSTSVEVPYTVTGVATTTVLEASPASPTSFGVAVLLTATATSGSGTPTGSVQFKDGATVLATQPLSSGGATLTTTALSASVHSLTAVLVPTGAFEASTSTALPFTVNAAATTTTLSAVPAASSTFGDSVALTATVANTPTPAVKPTGSVQFKDGATVLGTSTLNASGVATFATAGLAVGARTLSAVYVPTGGFTASNSADTAFTVAAAATSTTLTTSPTGSANAGAAVTISATVANTTSPSGGKPTGTVQLTDNGASFGSPVALDAAGVATVTTSTLAPGVHSFTAVYAPTGGFTASTSAAVDFNVVLVVPTVVTPTKITGTPRVGAVLTCVRGTFANATAYTYKFLRNGAVVQSSATVATRKMAVADLNSTYSCLVIASNGAFTAQSVSAGLKIRPGAAPVVRTKPAIKGTARVGKVLTAYRGVWSTAPTAYRFIWKRGATMLGRGTTYRATRRDRGKVVTLFVYAIKTGHLTGVSSTGRRIR